MDAGRKSMPANIRVRVYVCTYTFARVCAYMYVKSYMSIQGAVTSSRFSQNVYACIYSCTCVRVYICTCACICEHIYTCNITYVYQVPLPPRNFEIVAAGSLSLRATWLRPHDTGMTHMCMYTCMYVFSYICMYVYMYIRIHMCLYICIYKSILYIYIYQHI